MLGEQGEAARSLEELVATLRLGAGEGKQDCRSFQRRSSRGLPGGTVVGSPPANAGDTGSSPGPGRSHMPRSN